MYDLIFSREEEEKHVLRKISSVNNRSDNKEEEGTLYRDDNDGSRGTIISRENDSNEAVNRQTQQMQPQIGSFSCCLSCRNLVGKTLQLIGLSRERIRRPILGLTTITKSTTSRVIGRLVNWELSLSGKGDNEIQLTLGFARSNLLPDAKSAESSPMEVNDTTGIQSFQLFSHSNEASRKDVTPEYAAANFQRIFSNMPSDGPPSNVDCVVFFESTTLWSKSVIGVGLGIGLEYELGRLSPLPNEDGVQVFHFGLISDMRRLKRVHLNQGRSPVPTENIGDDEVSALEEVNLSFDATLKLSKEDETLSEVETKHVEEAEKLADVISSNIQYLNPTSTHVWGKDNSPFLYETLGQCVSPESQAVDRGVEERTKSSWRWTFGRVQFIQVH